MIITSDSLPRKSLSSEQAAHFGVASESISAVTISLIISRELAIRLVRGGIWQVLENSLAAVTSTRYAIGTARYALMPNVHAPDKESLSFYIPRTLATRVKKAALERGETLTEYLTNLFTNATNHIELTADDYRAIADATERASKKRQRCSTLYPPSSGVTRETREMRKK